MMETLTHRKVTYNDLGAIIHLLLEDDLGQTRESMSNELDKRYIEAFHKIDSDPNQYLMVVENGNEIIGTCHSITHFYREYPYANRSCASGR